MRRSLTPSVVLALALVLVMAGCSSSDPDIAAGATSSAPAPDTCPIEPVTVVVSVDQWGDIVEQLAGDCGDVTTIIEGSVDDPHDYEPTTADTAEFADAQLVVMNGLDYDHWADDALETLDPQPAVVNAGDVIGLEEGANPHIWYQPTHVTLIADAVTFELQDLAPDADAYFFDRAAAWAASTKPLFDEVNAISGTHPDATFAATEPVFDLMAESLGMVNLTPQGYQNAAANESEPAPADVNEFLQLLSDGSVDVLIYNSQTEGAVPEQLREAAETAGVAFVEVTETVPPDAASFVGWQVGQLEALATALDPGGPTSSG